MINQKSPLKIGLVIDTDLDKPDGVQQYTLAIGRYLSRQGHQVRYLAGDTKRTDLAGLYSLSKNIILNSNGNRMSIPLLASRAQIKAVIEREEFDILHIQTPYHPFMAGQVINLAPKKTLIVGTFHVLPKNQLLYWANYLLGLICWRSLKRFDQMFAVSEAAQNFCQKTFKMKSIVLPNTVDWQIYHQAKALLKYQDDLVTILFFGRLVPRKGALTLLKAVSQLSLETKQKIRVLICGSGPEEANLKGFVNRSGLSKLVNFCGFIDESLKPRYYASADIAVFPSSGGESFGIVLLEAMASGQAAVLGGNNPGYQSVLKDRPELLFNPASLDELTDKLEEYINNQTKRRQAANWAANYSRRYDINTVGAELTGYYYSLLAKKSL